MTPMDTLPTRPWDGGDWIPASLLVKAGIKGVQNNPTKLRQRLERVGYVTAASEGVLWRVRPGYKKELEYHGPTLLPEDAWRGVLARFGHTAQRASWGGLWLTASQMARLGLPGLPRDATSILRWGRRRGWEDAWLEGLIWRRRQCGSKTGQVTDFNAAVLPPAARAALHAMGLPAGDGTI